jgi:ATP-dependent Clp protease ATP-binding subunit ClpX
MDGVELLFEDDVIDLIVEKAFEFKLGARGLRSICEAIMLDYMFDMPSDEKKVSKLNITLNDANRQIDKLRLKSLKAA